ncbi:hypothetical protein ACHAWF_009647 [Thalassiosira exigua]
MRRATQGYSPRAERSLSRDRLESTDRERRASERDLGIQAEQTRAAQWGRQSEKKPIASAVRNATCLGRSTFSFQSPRIPRRLRERPMQQVSGRGSGVTKDEDSAGGQGASDFVLFSSVGGASLA